MNMTPIYRIDEINSNQFFIKREDFIPFSFGGNKARKAELFFREIENGDCDCVVTYGSSSSNHCRIVANECCRRDMPCYIVSPEEASEQTFNSQILKLFGAVTETVPVNEVHNTIERKLDELTQTGKKPYFIPGGGHGNIGTEAYVQCYAEIREQEQVLGIHFDYIFFASGTGTTHAGLVCGQLLASEKRKIVGISIARKNPKGRDIIVDSVRGFLGNRATEEQIQEATIFVDDFTSGYGKDDQRVIETIKNVMRNYGIPLDATYTGKAFLGMQQYIEKEQISKKNILFIHTGGTPLFFNTLKKISEEL